MKARAVQAGAATEKTGKDNKQVAYETYDAENDRKIDDNCFHVSLMNIACIKYKVLNEFLIRYLCDI